MRLRLTLVVCILTFATMIAPSQAATYQLAATYKDSIYLISEDGKYASKLIKDFNGTIDPDLLMLSHDGKLLAAYARVKGKLWLCRVDIATGEIKLVRQVDDTYPTQYCQSWFGNSVLFDEQPGVYAIDIFTGEKRLIVPPGDDEFAYEGLLESPSGKLIATAKGVTACTSFSVRNGLTGKLIWPKRASVDDDFWGVTDFCWSPDSKWLFVTFDGKIKDDPMLSGPGGLWKIDAMTGRQHLLKYKGQNVQEIKFSSDGKLLAVSRDRQIDILSYPSLALVRSLKYTGSVYFLEEEHYLVFDGSIAAEIKDSTVTTHRYMTKEFNKEGSQLEISLSAEKDALLLCCTSISGSQKAVSGILDLHSGKKSILPKGVYRIVWLQNPVTR